MKRFEKTKGFIAGILLATLIIGLTMSVHAQLTARQIEVYTGVAVYLNDVRFDPRDRYGNPIETFTYQGNTYVPVEEITRAWGGTVHWVPETLSLYLNTPNIATVPTPAPASPPAALIPGPTPSGQQPIPAATPTPMQVYGIGDTISLPNASLRVIGTSEQTEHRGQGSSTFPFDGHVFLVVEFEVTANNRRFDNTLWSSVEFIGGAIAASGFEYHQPMAFGDTAFPPNTARVFSVYISVPQNETITGIIVRDGVSETATVNLR